MSKAGEVHLPCPPDGNRRYARATATPQKGQKGCVFVFCDVFPPLKTADDATDVILPDLIFN